MGDGVLLESVEGLGRSPFVASAGEIWELLQSEREEVCRHLLAGGPLCHSNSPGLQEAEASKTNGRKIEWRHRGQLEGRPRDVNNALDRLIDGGYGRCTDCGDEIEVKRLRADPAAYLCFACQRTVNGETRFRTM